ncbi:PIR Superfamily Protein [Plasmodium ovale curtisi]|uniref:PIR Superfamily Protein n=1 Tax=Plasmodium ovale curtisi TaxID=864141 RepID=A0A1A8WQR2_PLAOA|nr:PIR Superfamily Protein [Plasmodium ovale curtisi]
MDLSSVDNEILRKNTFEQNNDLKNFYNELDNVCTNDRNCTHNSLDSTNDANTQNLYKKLDANIFKFIINKEFRHKNLPQDINKRCTYFKYWFYDQIIINQLDDEKIGHIIKCLPYKNDKNIEFEIGNTERDSKKCYFHIQKLHDIKKMKVLYDYLETYNVPEKKSKINGILCQSKYKQFFNNFISLYNQLHDCNSESQEYCKEFEGCKKIYHETPSELHCEGDKSLIYSEPGSGDLHSTLRSLAASPNIQALAADSSYLSSASSEGVTSYTGVTTVSSAAVTSVIIFILYKATPLGTWLRNSFQKVKNIPLYLDENEPHKLLDQELISDSVNIDSTSHYIAYHPS